MNHPVPYAFAIWVTSVVLGGFLFFASGYISGNDSIENGWGEVIFGFGFICLFGGAFSFPAFLLLIFIISLLESVQGSKLIKCGLLWLVTIVICYCVLTFVLRSGNLFSMDGMDEFFIDILIKYSIALLVGIIVWNPGLHREVYNWFTSPEKSNYKHEQSQPLKRI